MAVTAIPKATVELVHITGWSKRSPLVVPEPDEDATADAAPTKPDVMDMPNPSPAAAWFRPSKNLGE